MTSLNVTVPAPHVADCREATPVTSDYRRAVADDLGDEGDERRLRDRARDARDRAVEARRQAEVRIRQEGERRDWVHVLLDTYDRDRRRAGGLLSGGLAFRLFVWSLPFALVLVTSLGFLVDGLDHTVESLGQGSGLSATIVDAVSKGVEASSRNRFALLLLGLILLFLASTSGLRALNVVSIIAWELEPRAPTRMVAGSIAFALTITAVAGIHLIANALYGGGFGTDILTTIALIAADTAIVYAALRRLPHGATRGWTLLPGALLFGVGVEVLRLFTAVYLVGKMARIGDLYGSLGLAVVILGWLFIIGRLVVTGCMLNASVAYGRLPAEPQPDDGARSPLDAP
jgi:membrane protein